MIEDENKYAKTVHPDGRIEFVPIPVKEQDLADWEPVYLNGMDHETEEYFAVDSEGRVYSTNLLGGSENSHSYRIHTNFTTYPTREMAEKAAVLMKRNNAIIKACLLVDPDYVPDWTNRKTKFAVYYDHIDSEWVVGWSSFCSSALASAYVSTEKKAIKVCELLTKWGIKQ